MPSDRITLTIDPTTRELIDALPRGWNLSALFRAAVRCISPLTVEQPVILCAGVTPRPTIRDIASGRSRWDVVVTSPQGHHPSTRGHATYMK